MELGYLNGTFMPEEEMMVSATDRGYLFGDGVYEVTRVYNGTMFGFTPHRDRLYRSLREMKMQAPCTPEELEKIHLELIEKSGITNGYIYLQVTRGQGPRNHSFYNKGYRPNLMMFIHELSDAIADKAKNGVKAITYPDERWHRCDIKTVNLIANTLAQSEADAQGCHSAILIREGMVMEGASSNVFIVHKGTLYTHPVDHLILNGVTRRIVLEQLVPTLTIPVEEKIFAQGFLADCEEAFFTSTTAGIMPIIEIDGLPVGNGEVGPITRKLQQAMAQLLEKGYY